MRIPCVRQVSGRVSHLKNAVALFWRHAHCQISLERFFPKAPLYCTVHIHHGVHDIIAVRRQTKIEIYEVASKTIYIYNWECMRYAVCYNLLNSFLCQSLFLSSESVTLPQKESIFVIVWMPAAGEMCVAPLYSHRESCIFFATRIQRQGDKIVVANSYKCILHILAL